MVASSCKNVMVKSTFSYSRIAGKLFQFFNTLKPYLEDYYENLKTRLNGQLFPMMWLLIFIFIIFCGIIALLCKICLNSPQKCHCTGLRFYSGRPCRPTEHIRLAKYSDWVYYQIVDLYVLTSHVFYQIAFYFLSFQIRIFISFY